MTEVSWKLAKAYPLQEGHIGGEVVRYAQFTPGGVRVTVNKVLPDTDPEVAVIVDVPTVTLVASPLEIIVSTDVVPEVHVIPVGNTCDVLSEKCPVAINCTVVLGAILGFAGATEIDTSVAEDTVSVVLPDTAPVVAVMVEVPAATPVASPAEFIVATEVVPDNQVACPVMSSTVPSE